jgi:2-oxo-4-hydroxy-4-carboxy-5-ureidoimidazoline decarboxylase
MREPHSLLNQLPAPDAARALLRCCGAQRWVAAMLERRPFADTPQLMAAAEDAYAKLQPHEYLEAFAHHPQIGADLGELARKFASTASWSAGEQAGVAAADIATLTALRDRNREYLARFGYIFIVCATGKSAHEMLQLLEARITHDAATELRIAAGEQAKIMRLRLEKLAQQEGP